MKNGAGLKVKTNYSNKNCAIHDIVVASGTLSLTESFLYVRARASHCSCPPYLIHHLPGKKKIMSADSMQSPHSSPGLVYRVHVRRLVSSSIVIPEWSVIVRMCDPCRATKLASVAEP